MNILITGASSGIDNALEYEYAKYFSNTGANIGLVARRIEHLHKLAGELQSQYSISCTNYSLDVRDAAALEVAAQNFIARFGVPNILIANAGVTRGTLTELKKILPHLKQYLILM